MLRTIIVDDEHLARDNIRIALEREQDVTVVAECANGAEAVAAIRRHDPDLVFLDVQMPGMGGFDVIEAIGVDHMPPLIFVTAFDSHALHAFEVRALDYLLKPFDDARLGDALRRARTWRSKDGESLASRLQELLEAMRQRDLPGSAGGATPITRFVVRESDRAIPIRVEEVDWIEAEGNYAVLHVGKGTYRLRVSLKKLATQLDAKRFARAHKSAIVNLDRIREVQPWFGGDYVAILHNGDKVRVSRTYAAAVLEPLQ